jgi:hypothetical protein
MGDAEEDGRWMTFRELASARDISLASAGRLVRRRHWRRQKDNQGTVRVLVPPGEELPSEHRPADSRPDDLSDIHSNGETLRTLREAIALLRERFAQLEQRAAKSEARAERAEAELEREREAARRLAEQIAGSSADLARLTTIPVPSPPKPAELPAVGSVLRGFWKRLLRTRPHPPENPD